MSQKNFDVRTRTFLGEMGIGPIWTLRHGTSDNAGEPSETVQIASEKPMQDAWAEHAAAAPEPEPQLFMSSSPDAPIANFLGPDGANPYAPGNIADMDWPTLAETVAGCVKCRLCNGRTRTVFGAGDRKATWLFIGEGPGRNEDQQGEPFIGPAGRLLDNMLRALHIQRGDNAYIANVVKCRPVDANGRDRPPTAEETGACLPYLQRQIALIQPTVLVALGKTAAVSLLGLDPETPVGSLRGKVHRYGNLPLVVTYHPAYLLRRLQDKAKVWQDLCMAVDAHDGKSFDAA